MLTMCSSCPHLGGYRLYDMICMSYVVSAILMTDGAGDGTITDGTISDLLDDLSQCKILAEKQARIASKPKERKEQAHVRQSPRGGAESHKASRIPSCGSNIAEGHFLHHPLSPHGGGGGTARHHSSIPRLSPPMQGVGSTVQQWTTTKVGLRPNKGTQPADLPLDSFDDDEF